MYLSQSLILSVLASHAAAAGVVGSAFGFAKGATGGGNATPVYPKDIKELTTFLTDAEPRVIVLNKEYNYIGSEGKVTEDGCRPSSNTCPGNGGQDAINGANWCNGQPKVSVTYDKAGTSAINVASDKSIVGEGTSGVIRGKGLRIANGAKNVIIQNIHITELNPQYIWGGDAITMLGSDNVWIDHVKTSLIGRQHIVTGYDATSSLTISNSEIDGSTSWSASCDNHHYWAILLLGKADKVTFQGNYIHHTSGRSPKVGGEGSGTLIHAVNNLWSENSGHAFDISESGKVIAEGNVFQNVKTPLNGGEASLFAADASNGASCQAALGYACQANQLTGSGPFAGSNTGVLAGASGEGVKPIDVGTVAQSVKSKAGVGKI